MIIPTPKNINQKGKLNIDFKNQNYRTLYYNVGSTAQITIFTDILSKQLGLSFKSISSPILPEIKLGFIIQQDLSLKSNQYKLEIGEIIKISGKSSQAINWGLTSFLQLIPLTRESKSIIELPRCEILDEPNFPYIGLMVDLARKWHPISVIKEIIELCAWYKIFFLHIHFTDDQSFTLPIESYPKLATKDRHYSKTQIQELNQFAADRGIIIIPEIDLPGHSRALVNAYPKSFALKPKYFWKPKPNVVNIGKEEAYRALEQIIDEVIKMFPDSPYFHLGADEVDFVHLENDPDVQQYCITHQIPNHKELYRHFIVRMNDHVKIRGKQMCVWEGFHSDGVVPIPKEIPVFVFESLYNTADKLVADGYTVVNTSWTPIYITPHKNWSPREIYAWNPLRWENWFEKSLAHTQPIELKNTHNLMGAQMCSWEQSAEMEIPSLRHRIAAFIEKVWNLESKTTYDEFELRLNEQDKKFEILRTL